MRAVVHLLTGHIGNYSKKGRELKKGKEQVDN